MQSIGIHNHVISVRSIPPGIPTRAHPDKPLDFVVLVFCVEVEVKPTAFACSSLRCLVNRDVGASASWVSEDYEATVRIGVLDLVP